MKGLTSNKRSVLVLGIVIMVVLALVCWKFVLSPALDAGNQQQANLQSTQTEIDAKTVSINTQCKTLKDIQRILDEARKNQEKFPPTADVSELFNQIRRAANSAGIPTKNIASVNAPAPAIGDINTIAEMPVTITITSKYTQVTTFLAALEAMPRSFVVTNMAVTGGSTPSTVAVTINGNAFIIQTKSLQDILTQVYNDKIPIRQACGLLGLPPLSGATPTGTSTGGDNGAFTSPTTPPANNPAPNNTAPAITPTQAPTNQLPIVPVQPNGTTPNTSGTGLPS